MLYFQELLAPVFIGLEVDSTPENGLKTPKILKIRVFCNYASAPGNLLACCARDKRERCWIAYGLNRQVDIQPWPIQMIMGGPLNVRYLFNRSLSKPGELIKRYEQFFVSKQKPKTVL